MAYLYRHIRLDTNQVFYIGIGVRSGHRRARTIVRRNEFWKNIVAKTEWDAEIILDDISLEYAKIKEVEFIKLYGRKDIGEGTLVNLTDGGSGTSGYSVSEELKERLSIINKGKVLSDEHKRSISKAHKGKVFSPDTLSKMRQAKVGTKHSLETIEKRRAKMIGNKSTTGQTWSLIDGKRVFRHKETI
jgi:hypothetical protein